MKIVNRRGLPTKGLVFGLVEAIVIDNRDPNELGRVKVKFPTLPSQPESYWARVCTPMAGASRGWVSLPEIGDEVLVTFMHGSVEHALVVGALYNGVDVPPYQNKDGENNLRMFVSRSGHQMVFDDTDGKERMMFVTSKQKVAVSWNAHAKQLSVFCDGDIEIQAKNEVSVKCGECLIQTKENLHVAAQNINIKSGSQAAFASKGQLHLKTADLKIN